jgi:Lrp/AsnC family transcriptional regulator, leucine-responsive regulatory protein
MLARPPIDDLDVQIIALLREDARRTISDIADRVGLSAAPVKRRIERLERAGVIAGYTVLLDHSKLGPSVEAFTELRFVGDTDVEHILATAREIPEVVELFTTAGDPDALARIRVDDVDHLKHVISRLRRSGQVSGTKTLMVLDTWTRPLSVEGASEPS